MYNKSLEGLLNMTNVEFVLKYLSDHVLRLLASRLSLCLHFDYRPCLQSPEQVYPHVYLKLNFSQTWKSGLFTKVWLSFQTWPLAVKPTALNSITDATSAVSSLLEDRREVEQLETQTKQQPCDLKHVTYNTRIVQHGHRRSRTIAYLCCHISHYNS